MFRNTPRYLILALSVIAATLSLDSAAGESVKYEIDEGERLRNDNFSQAMVHFNKAVRLEPRSKEALFDRAELNFDNGNYLQAIGDFTKVLAINPNSHWSHWDRAAAYARVANEQAWLEDRKKAISLSPDLSQGALGSYAKLPASADSPQDYFWFVRPEGKTDQKRFDNWTRVERRIFCQICRTIESKQFGLVSRACNGVQIPLWLARRPHDPHKSMVADQSTHSLICYPCVLRETSHGIEWLMVHELTHLVDRKYYISTGHVWKKLVGSKMLACRRYAGTLGPQDEGNQLNPQATKFGLPSFYAATDPREALAECTAAMILSSWRPSPDIESFIRKRILSKPYSLLKKNVPKT